MSTWIRLEGADLGYGTEAVLRDVTLDVTPGDFIGILGPNGAGKTTLFRGLAGLIEPLHGKVQRQAGVSIGYVPQREHLDDRYPLTVEDVVTMGAYGRLRGLRRVSSEERALTRRCIDQVGLTHKNRDRFASLSGGQRQRALIARALLSRPQVLLLDEPTSGVDRAQAERILALLAELRRERELAVLLVSHQIDLVRRAVEHVAWVAEGTVRVGPAEEWLRPERLDELFHGQMPKAEA